MREDVYTSLKDIVKGKDSYVAVQEEENLREAFDDVIERKKLSIAK